MSDPAELFALTELADVAKSKLWHLPEMERIVLSMHLLGDVALHEVAEALGVREHRAQQLYRDGLRHLRCALVAVQ